jgi:ferredoxin
MWLRNEQTLCGILGLSISLGVTCLYAQESRDEVIKQQCALKWPDNFQMQAVCIEEQVKGRESLSRPVDPHVSPEEHAKLRAHCEKKWPDDFKMRAYCEERQITGLRELQSPLPQDMTSKEFSIAMTHCTKEWPDDFKMRASCLHQQTEALRMLKRQ